MSKKLFEFVMIFDDTIPVNKGDGSIVIWGVDTVFKGRRGNLGTITPWVCMCMLKFKGYLGKYLTNCLILIKEKLS